MNASRTVRAERLKTELPAVLHADERAPQHAWVNLVAHWEAPASPASIEQCVDCEPLYNWLTREWPRMLHTPLLETRINELPAFVFGMDRRVQSVWFGLYRKRMSRCALGVGTERLAMRLELEAQRRCAETGLSVSGSQAAAPRTEKARAILTC